VKQICFGFAVWPVYSSFNQSCLTNNAPECGWLRWVATEQDRRREGLARALVIGVLAIAKQAGCREARLHTETDRLAAIALYLQLGFEPLVRSDPEREAWEQVVRFLRANDPYRKHI
jgi:GNAT superfamily N-acetyltransferase